MPGDSGSPLVRNVNGVRYQLGVVSFGADVRLF
jgi:secreted trypsin-like serine protease